MPMFDMCLLWNLLLLLSASLLENREGIEVPCITYLLTLFSTAFSLQINQSFAMKLPKKATYMCVSFSLH